MWTMLAVTRALAGAVLVLLHGCAGPATRPVAPAAVEAPTAITRDGAASALWNARGLAGRREYSQARAALQKIIPDAERWAWLDIAADAHFMIGEMYERERAVRDGADAYARSYDASRRAGDTARGVRALNALGNTLLDAGAYDKAVEVSTEAARLAARDRALAAQATAQNNLGEAHRLAGRFAEAREAYDRALALAREAGDRRAQVAVLVNLGATERRASRFADARRHFTEARELADRLNDAQAVTYAQWNLDQIDAESPGVGGRQTAPR
jgi:tetratricopeptide (TPR) repeat protein